jgi:hypothetical protein
VVIEHFGYKPLFVVTIGFYALSSFVYLAVLKEKQRADAEPISVKERVA